ncbi:hypothetical protein CUC15_02470 [Oceanobacillus zhaokaii]|uniref:DUF4097 domain-containing protein n=1 Tax=Oceanobacillus zhaokaii TaxID=2052660 RepID=A0A345PD30_9BACI|nr:DUF4097 family beta strand repeat-containing protein [Oceanobacillus zhaokaii]AXI07910.1 hypothetical protein CUC15_02470 [Oceanobacillus zhaokaii]
MKNLLKRSAPPIIEEDTFDIDKLHYIGISTGLTDVEVLTHEESGIALYFETYVDGPALETEIEDGRFEVKVKERNRNQGLFSINFSSARLQLTLPKAIAYNWEIRTGSGDVEISNIITESISMRTGSGDIEAIRILSKQAQIIASSGDLSLKDSEVEKLSFETSSGEAKLKNISSDVIHGSASSGDVVVKNLHGKSLEIETSSGEIELEKIIVDKASLRANSGDIAADHLMVEETSVRTSSGIIDVRSFTGNVKAVSSSGDVAFSAVNEAVYDIETSSGDITVELSSEQLNATIEARTKSGKIETNLPLQLERQAKDRLEGIIGSGENPIILKARSGDIKILQANRMGR